MIPVVDQIQRDHFSDNFAHRSIDSQLDEVERKNAQSYWECRLLVDQVESLIKDPTCLKGLSENERRALEKILQSGKPTQRHHRLYAEDMLGLCDTKEEKDEEDTPELSPSAKAALQREMESALLAKYERVSSFVRAMDNAAKDENPANIVQNKKQQLYREKADLSRKRIALMDQLVRYIKITLEVLDTIWNIMIEFKYGHEKEKNKIFDAYYCALADSLLIRIKLLHVSVLLATYDKQLVSALKSLRSILEARFIEARTQLSFVQKKLQAYKDMGPEFETIAEAYFHLLDNIKATQDDIERIKNN